MDRVRLSIRMSIIALYAAFFCSAGLQGQAFELKVKPLSEKSSFGPNRLHFTHFFLGTAWIPPVSRAGDSQTGFSLGFRGGLRYKIRLSRSLALVAEAGIAGQKFRMQPGFPLLPGDTLSFRRQSLSVTGFEGAFGLRIRLGQRGNYLGTYIDAGISATTPVSSVLSTTMPSPESGGSGIRSDMKIKRRVDCIRPFLYAPYVRLGFNKLAVQVSWRPSAMTDQPANYDMPALQIGIEFSPVRY